MKDTKDYLRPDLLQQNYTDWTIIDPLLFARKLNKLLKTTEIQREFDRCTRAADAVKRWEVLEHFGFDRYPAPRQPIEGERFLKPRQVVTMDWDYNLGRGRRPLYHEYVMPMLCHWRASADLMIARRLMPDLEWVVVSSEKHTAVMAPAEQLIWDPTYFALDVSAQSTLHSLFGKDLDDTDYDFYPEEYAFSRHTVELMHIWSLVDSHPEERRLDLVRGMGNELSHYRSEDIEHELGLISC